jgi:acetyl esterase
MGDSAGGNLAAVVAQQTRPGHRPRTGPGRGAEPAAPPPVAQVLLYPGVDAHMDTSSVGLFADGFMLTRGAMEAFREAYVPDPEDWESSLVSPLLASDVSGVAPALVVTAGFDPLRDEGAAYAGRLRDEGVEVTYRCYDDQIHGFFSMGLLPGGMALSTEICEAAGRLVRRSPVPVDPSADGGAVGAG